MWWIVVGAAPVRPTPGLIARLSGADRVLAADRGARTALRCGLTPVLALGDFDSLDRRTMAELRRRQIPLERHPTDKAATDGELAVQRALTLGATTITFVGSLGGDRLDHGIANLLLLGQPALANVPTTLLDNRNEARLLRAGQSCAWQGTIGEYVSLLPIDGDAAGVTTTGLRWPLAQATLVAGSTRAVSNELATPHATVTITTGRLLVTRSLRPPTRDWPPLDPLGLLRTPALP